MRLFLKRYRRHGFTLFHLCEIYEKRRGEVTEELWQAVMGEEHCVYEMRRTSVTANFNKKGFSLPTEAEWECAAMSGRGHKYTGYNTENLLEVYAWYDKNSGGKMHELEKKKANKFGLYDMSGIVCGR